MKILQTSLLSLFFFGFVLGTGSIAAESTPPAKDVVAPVEVPVAELDAQLAKERLRKIYGEFNLKLAGDWLVTVDGRTDKWRWNADKQAWVCPTDQKARCAELIPQVFKWWGRGKGWAQDWNPVKRESLEFGRVRNESAEIQMGTGSAAEDPNADEVKTFEGKKTADEVWIWKSTAGAEAKLYISMRDQKIERIESGDGVERIEWFQKQPGATPELTKLLVERGGIMMTLLRVK